MWKFSINWKQLQQSNIYSFLNVAHRKSSLSSRSIFYVSSILEKKVLPEWSLRKHFESTKKSDWPKENGCKSLRRMFLRSSANYAFLMIFLQFLTDSIIILKVFLLRAIATLKVSKRIFIVVLFISVESRSKNVR